VGNNFATISRWNWLLGFLILAASGIMLLDGQNREQARAEQAATLMRLEQGVAPLFVLGDVNEDGQVNAADAALIEQLAAGRSPAAATCPAAADFNLDGKIDSADIEIMRRMLERGPITIPALHFQYRLPCSFKNLALAARPAAEGGTNLVYFLDRRFNPVNSRVEVAEGQATATPLAGGEGYMVSGSSADTKSATVTLLITLGNRASGGRYYYTYDIGSEATAP
jgi:hypothetical protein